LAGQAVREEVLLGRFIGTNVEAPTYYLIILARKMGPVIHRVVLAGFEDEPPKTE
jgi:hypothetical protein